MSSDGENNQGIDVGQLSLMILEELLKPIAHEVTSQAIQMEKRIRSQYGPDFVAKPYNTTLPAGVRAKSAHRTELAGRVAYIKVPGRDIYGNEKSNDVRYFECLNCSRKIAGSRFAAHMERCLNGRNSRANGRLMGSMMGSSVSTSGYNSVYASPSPVTTPAGGGGTSDTGSGNESADKRKRKLVASTDINKRQCSEGPPSKTAVSKFFDRGKLKKSHSTPTSPIDWNRMNDESDTDTFEISKKKVFQSQDSHI